jgi:hypothetical protein
MIKIALDAGDGFRRVPGCGKDRADWIIVVSHATVSIFRRLELAGDVVFPVAVVEIWRRLSTAIFDPYRPELHYMRGPGPKWREKRAYAGSIDLAPPVNGTSADDVRTTPISAFW